MDLSAEQFIQLVNSAKADDTNSAERDQRRAPRVALRMRANIIPLSESSNPAAIGIQVRDVSPAGFGFLHVTKMSLDDKFALVLPRNGETPAVVLCAVAFWQPLARDLFAVGARFIRILRDSGDPPLPIQLDAPSGDLAAEIQRLHRRAS